MNLRPEEISSVIKEQIKRYASEMDGISSLRKDWKIFSKVLEEYWNNRKGGAVTKHISDTLPIIIHILLSKFLSELKKLCLALFRFHLR